MGNMLSCRLQKPLILHLVEDIHHIFQFVLIAERNADLALPLWGTAHVDLDLEEF